MKNTIKTEAKIYEFNLTKRNVLKYCGCYGKAKSIVESVNFISEDGKYLLSCDDNVIGNYVEDGNEFRYEEDGDYDTTYGKLAENLTSDEIQVIHDEMYEFELPIELRK